MKFYINKHSFVFLYKKKSYFYGGFGSDRISNKITLVKSLMLFLLQTLTHLSIKNNKTKTACNTMQELAYSNEHAKQISYDVSELLLNYKSTIRTFLLLLLLLISQIPNVF